MKLGVLKENSPGETRVALVPAHIAPLLKQGYEVLVEEGAGSASGFTDQEYVDKGAKVLSTNQVIDQATILLTVRSGAASENGKALAEKLKAHHVLIGMLEPYQKDESFDHLLKNKVTSFSLELIPRTTRAQSMDVLSSMANLAGYSAVLAGAQASPKILPMLMTAAGTIPPASVFILGVGVAGLQAIATARRLGAVVSAYDVRSEVKEQVESLGAKFVVFDLESATGEGGYAKQMDDAYYEKQRQLMKEELSTKDIVITTANIPGKKAPVLITEEMVKGMAHGSVIVDLAAERGGNCELTESGKTVVQHGVTILGPENLAASLYGNTSTLYSKNMTTFLNNLLSKEEKTIQWDDDIVAATVVTKEGQIPNERTRSWIGGTV
jgi:NAD(P) transhydrogenase subunit alpha